MVNSWRCPVRSEPGELELLLEQGAEVLVVPLGHHRLVQGVLPCLLVQRRVHVPVVPPQHRPQEVVRVVERVHQCNSIRTHLLEITIQQPTYTLLS
jgi:hypothetical protein